MNDQPIASSGFENEKLSLQAKQSSIETNIQHVIDIRPSLKQLEFVMINFVFIVRSGVRSIDPAPRYRSCPNFISV